MSEPGQPGNPEGAPAPQSVDHSSGQESASQTPRQKAWKIIGRAARSLRLFSTSRQEINSQQNDEFEDKEDREVITEAQVGNAHLIGIEIIGLEGHLRRLHPDFTDQKIKTAVGEYLSRYETIQRNNRARDAQQTISEEAAYDFSERPELKETLDAIVNASRIFLAERLKAHHISDTEIQARTAPIHPYYVIPQVPSENGGNGAEDQGRIAELGGQVDTDGLILVYPNRITPQQELTRPYEVGRLVAHEMSHGAMGERNIITYTQTPTGEKRSQIVIVGLERHEISEEPISLTRKGALLENAFAELDTSRIYASHALRDNKILQPLLQAQHALVQNASPSMLEMIQTNPQYEQVREAYISSLKRTIAARDLGVPSEWIESATISDESLDQIVILWKLARIIGYQMTPKIRRVFLRQSRLVERGLHFLEESRIKGTDGAHKMIANIFQDDADTVLLASDHPTTTDRENILRLIMAKEGTMNRRWIRTSGNGKRKKDETDLY